MGSVKMQNLYARNTLQHSPRLKSQPSGVGAEWLPGADWLGYGYRPFGMAIDSDCMSRENLFQFPEFDQFSFLGRTYRKPVLVDALMQNQARVERVDAHSVKDTVTEIYDKLMGGCSRGLFKGEFELSYSRSLEKHWEYRSAAIQMVVRLLRLTLPAEMRPYLNRDVAAALEDAGEDAEAKAAGRTPHHGTDFKYFFDRYGTHYVSGLHVGGSYNLYMTFCSSAYKSVDDIKAKVSAAYNGVTGSNQTDISRSMAALDEKQELFVTAYGGQEAPTDWSQLASWQQAVRANPGPNGFYGNQMQGLTPIYTLAGQPARRDALKGEWKAYCDRNTLVLGKMGRVVTGIKVVADPNPTRARAKAREGGFELIDVDLNRGAGGEFVFLGKKFGDGETETPLLDLVGIEGTSSSISEPRGYKKHETDLNKGAGGRFIYLCSVSGDGADELLSPIRDITVESSREPLTAKHFENKKWSVLLQKDTQKPLDLNLGAKGDFVYVAFSRV